MPKAKSSKVRPCTTSSELSRGATKRFQRLVRAHARLLAPVAEGGPFPVVLLEHGSSVVPAIYTVLAEGLASSGFIVVATNHPPDSLISVFPDGHELKFTPYWPAEADRRTPGVAIGKFADVDEDEPGRAARSRGISALSYRVKEIVGSV